MEYVLKLPFKKAIKLILKAQEEETKEYAFRLYISDKPRMNKDNYKTFNEYWEDIRPKQIITDTRSEEEIMMELIEIENKFRKEE